MLLHRSRNHEVGEREGRRVCACGASDEAGSPAGSRATRAAARTVRFHERRRYTLQRLFPARIVMAELQNPALAGDVPFDTVVYASAGSNYAGVPALAQYKIYDAPTAGFITPRLNISPFANLGGGAPWSFPNTSVPLNGHICIPRGRGPFPLMMFAHGNHGPLENSTPGYLYLCQLLASHGVIGATIDVNFLNGWNFGENDARGIVHLEHVKQFRTWNSHGRPSAARQGRSQSHRDRRPLTRRRRRRPRVVLQSPDVDQAGHHDARRPARWIGRTRSVRVGPHGCSGDRTDRSPVSAADRADGRSRCVLPDSRQPRRGCLEIRGLQHLQPRACGEHGQSDSVRRRVEDAVVGVRCEPQPVQQHLGF